MVSFLPNLRFRNALVALAAPLVKHRLKKLAQCTEVFFANASTALLEEDGGMSSSILHNAPHLSP